MNISGQIGIVMKKPDKTADHSSREEVLTAFNFKDPEREKYYSALIEEVYRETNGDIPAGIRMLAERVKDPADVGAFMYLIGQTLTEQRIMKEIPEIVKEAMNTGAEIAIRELMKDDPDQSGQPASDDPVYYG